MKKYIVLFGLLFALVQANGQDLASQPKVSNKLTKKTSTKAKVTSTKEKVVELTDDYLYDKGLKHSLWTRWIDGKLSIHIEVEDTKKITPSKLDFHYNAALNQAKKIKEQVLKAYAGDVGNVSLWFASAGVYIGAEYPSGNRITKRLHKD